MWTGRRWRRLLNLIDHLPRNSFFVQAVAEDEEMAERLADSDRGPTVTFASWSYETELLAAVFDRLGSVTAALIALGGSKPPTIEPWPRPESAARRASMVRRFSQHETLVARLIPREGL